MIKENPIVTSSNPGKLSLEPKPVGDAKIGNTFDGSWFYAN